ncbi:MAG: hypothetical protein NVS2B16_20740 [Chloroflexota bacterium]
MNLAQVTIVGDSNAVGAYKPKAITIHVGRCIAFSNASHTVTADMPRAFDSGTIATGKSWALTVKHPGVFAYHCVFHPLMHGKIVVKR